MEPLVICWCGTRIVLARCGDEDVLEGRCPTCGAEFACCGPPAKTIGPAEGS